MKKNATLPLLLVIIVFTSCRGTKNITMFQDLANKASVQNSLEEPPQHKIKPFDNLYLSILTLDAEVNQIFNPSMAGNGYSSGTQYMFGTPVGQYINGYRVSPEGTVEVPILGTIKLSGLTLEQAEKVLKERAEVYLQEPTVQVKLLNFRVKVLGEVNNPGFFYNYEGNLNIIEAIALANGINEFANLKNVIVNRQMENDTYSYKIDITNSSVYNSPVFFLQPNDLVYVPPDRIKRSRDNERIYSLLLSTVSTVLVVFTLLR
jgi:polysaccharide export outer membrane protein